MEEWPEILPIPFVDYEGEPAHAIAVSSARNAKIQRRTRGIAAVEVMSVRWVLTITEYGILRDFFKENLHEGAAQFTIELRYPRQTELTNWTVRFLEGFTCEFLEGMWSVAALLELVHGPLQVIAPLYGWTPFFVENEDDHVPFVDSENSLYCVKV